MQASSLNSTSSTAAVTASITDAAKLTISDYRVQVVAPATSSSAAVAYKVTRLSDGTSSSFDGPVSPATAITFSVDGVDIAVSGSATINDEFLVKPVANGASGFSVAITDKADIALGAPATTAASAANIGTGVIGAATVSSKALLPGGLTLNYNGSTGLLTGFPTDTPVTITNGAPPTTVTFQAGAPVKYDPATAATISFGSVTATIAPPTLPAPATVNLPAPLATLTYSASGKTLSGFPSPLAVTVTANGSSTVYGPGVPVPYTPGATLSFGGASFTLSGAPADGDTFKLNANPNGLGDNRNALLLGKLQSANTLEGGTTTFQGAYSQLVSGVGSKAHELAATSGAANSLLEQSVASQQSESGVNLDEEAANLLRYQQAYQAAGKLIQTASTLFSVLLSLGN